MPRLKRSQPAISFGRFTMMIVIAAIAVAILALVAFSPWALRGLSDIHGMNWSQLSNVGQAYTAAATLLSSFALAGVILSLIMQNQEARVSREQTIRSTSRRSRSDGRRPRPIRVVSSSRKGATVASETRARQYRYANQWVVHWQSMYELRRMNDEDLRMQLSRTLFSGDVGRDYWASARKAFIPAGSVESADTIVLSTKNMRKRSLPGRQNEVLPDGSQSVPSDPTRVFPSSWEVASAGIAMLGGAMVLGAAIGRRTGPGADCVIKLVQVDPLSERLLIHLITRSPGSS